MNDGEAPWQEPIRRLALADEARAEALADGIMREWYRPSRGWRRSKPVLILRPSDSAAGFDPLALLARRLTTSEVPIRVVFGDDPEVSHQIDVAADHGEVNGDAPTFVLIQDAHRASGEARDRLQRLLTDTPSGVRVVLSIPVDAWRRSSIRKRFRRCRVLNLSGAEISSTRKLPEARPVRLLRRVFRAGEAVLVLVGIGTLLTGQLPALIERINPPCLAPGERNEEFRPAFAAAYERAGGSSELGKCSEVHGVHQWGEGWTQDYPEAKGGPAAVMAMQPDRAVVLSGAAWRDFVAVGGGGEAAPRYGYPLSEPFRCGDVTIFHLSGARLQPTAMITLLNEERYVLFTHRALQVYERHGGPTGPLGAPTAEPRVTDGARLYEFEHGQIIEPSGATTPRAEGVTVPPGRSRQSCLYRMPAARSES